VTHPFLIALDGFVSNRFGNNIVQLRSNGFSDEVVLGCGIFNLLLTEFTLYVLLSVWFSTPLLDIICMRFTSSSSSSATSSAWIYIVVAQVFCNLVSSEICFTLNHYLLHRFQPAIHHMHHACFTPTLSTNLIFHPLDLMLEFSTPVGILLLNHYCWWNEDELVFLISFVIVQMWYALDHDEWCALPHYAHHIFVDSNYSIYINGKYKMQCESNRMSLIGLSKKKINK
jgi:sterol desaturase/sphingolipid hydroxylase (fatty acid hydroxylase superfamily)